MSYDSKETPAPQDFLTRERGSPGVREEYRHIARTLSELSAGEVYGSGAPSSWPRENTEIMIQVTGGIFRHHGYLSPILFQFPQGSIQCAETQKPYESITLNFEESLGRLKTARNVIQADNQEYDLTWTELSEVDCRWEGSQLAIWSRNAPWRFESPHAGWRCQDITIFHEDGRPASRTSGYYNFPNPENPRFEDLPHETFDYSTQGKIILASQDSLVTWFLDEEGRIYRIINDQRPKEDRGTPVSSYHFRINETKFFRDSEGRIVSVEFEEELFPCTFDRQGYPVGLKNGKLVFVWNPPGV